MAKYKCENKECKKSFTTNRGLASHKRMHKPTNCIKEAVEEAMSTAENTRHLSDPYIKTFKENLKSKTVCDGGCEELHRDKVQLGVELPEISEELNDTLNLIDNLMSDVAKQHSIQVQTRLEVYIKPRAWYIPEWLYNLVIKKHVHVTDHGTTVQLKENK